MSRVATLAPSKSKPSTTQRIVKLMNDKCRPKPALAIAALQRDQDQYNSQVEVEARIEAAAGLLTAALAGRIDHDLAETGAVRLIDGALRFLEVADQESRMAGASR